MASQFGPSALNTPANLVTLSRLLLTLPFLGMVVADGASWWAVSFWVALCITDGIDGHLARRQGATRSGAFLDPLADKVLVLGALFALVEIDRFWWVPVALITAREIFISLLRIRYGRQGLAVPARSTAKAKTFLQAIAIGLALAPSLVDLAWIPDAFLWASVVMALVSAVQYVADGSRVATTRGHHDR